MIKKITEIIKRGENSIILKNGIDTAIIGKPNVGKSSILNKLLREEKAIVTSIAGTTRDTIEGKVNIDGIILYGNTVDIYNPKCVRASVGNLWKNNILKMQG